MICFCNLGSCSWEINSYGYHGDDGFLYRDHGKGELFGPKFTANDTVGGGINYATQEFFFTYVCSVCMILLVYIWGSFSFLKEMC